MPSIVVTDDNNQGWVAVGFKPDTGEFVWVPADTELIVAPLPEHTPPEQPEPHDGETKVILP